MEKAKEISDNASMKPKNQLAILRSIQEDSPITRVDIKEKTRLSCGTATTCAKELLDRGVVTEIGAVTTGVGRRPVELDFDRATTSCLDSSWARGGKRRGVDPKKLP